MKKAQLPHLILLIMLCLMTSNTSAEYEHSTQTIVPNR